MALKPFWSYAVGGSIALVVGGSVMLGWALDLAVLKSIVPGWKPMMPSTALAFIFVGFSDLARYFRATGRLPDQSAGAELVCGWIPGAIGLATFAEYAAGINLGFYNLLFSDPDTTAEIRRMAPETALCLFLLSAAFHLDRLQNEASILTSAICGLILQAVGLSAIAAYALPALEHRGYFGANLQAIHTSFVFVLLGGLLLIRQWHSRGSYWSLSARSTAACAGGIILLVVVGLTTDRYLMEIEAADRISNGLVQGRALHQQERILDLVNSANRFVVGGIIFAAVFFAAVLRGMQRAIYRHGEAERHAPLRDQKLNAILAIIPIGVWILDSGMRTTFANQAAHGMLDLSPDRGKGSYVTEAGEALAPTETPWAIALEKGRSVHDAVIGYQPERGTLQWLNVNAVPMEFSDWKVVVVARDVTRKKIMEVNLKERVDELERWYAITFGRESRILELKSEVNDLLAAGGRNLRYLQRENLK